MQVSSDITMDNYVFMKLQFEFDAESRKQNYFEQRKKE